MAGEGDVTRALQAWGAGHPGASDVAVRLVYAQLRRIAQRRVAGGSPGSPSLGATGLAHEALERLGNQRTMIWRSRSQFFALAACMMRRILVDRGRAKRAHKRLGGGVLEAISIAEVEGASPVDILELHEALLGLARQDPRQARIVELRYFAGLTLEETARVVDLSLSSVKREWSLARVWLKREMSA